MHAGQLFKEMLTLICILLDLRSVIIEREASVPALNS